MDEDRPGLLEIADVFQDRKQMIEIVAVDGTDVIEAELLEQGAAGPKIPREFFGLARPVVDELRQMAAELLRRFAHGAIGAA